MRSSEDGNGYQAWQALLRARTARNATNLLNQSFEPTFTSPDPRINLRQWNKNTEEYATRNDERASEGIRGCSLHEQKIAPQDMRQHLMLIQARLSTAEEVDKEIEAYWDAIEEFSRDDKGQSGFIAPVGKGPVRQEQGGKHSGKSKGKRKMHEGLGFRPERGEQRRIGYYNWCWPIGHKEAQCWFEQDYTKTNLPKNLLQRDVREWTKPAKEGQGHSQQGKEKGRGKEKRIKSWNRKRQPGPGWISE